MEDRFKFRAWHKLSKKLSNIVGFTILDNNVIKLGELLDSGIRVYSNADKEHLILMQCTGLKDKNCNLIFEGDIVKKIDSNDLGYYRERTCRVDWHKEFMCYTITTTLGDGYPLSDFDSTQYEIIGNIHENSHLLEGN
jgi:uncharacterized phage protein (TIGR01671 family)